MALQIDPEIESKTYGSMAKPKPTNATTSDVKLTITDSQKSETDLEPEQSLYDKFQTELLEGNSICAKKSPQTVSKIMSVGPGVDRYVNFVEVLLARGCLAKKQQKIWKKIVSKVEKIQNKSP